MTQKNVFAQRRGKRQKKARAEKMKECLIGQDGITSVYKAMPAYGHDPYLHWATHVSGSFER